MKKVLIGLAVVAAVFAAKAEYLVWQVDTGAYSDTYTKAGIGVYGSEGRTAVLGLANVPTGQMTTDLSNYQSESYTYYIELFSYDSSAGTTTVAHSDTGFTYAQLGTKGYLADSMAKVQSMTATWSGVNYTAGAAPEPTSGLMMLVGMALLGLKRRRA